GVAASATRLRECLDLIYAIRKEVARVGSYASMLSDEDTRVNEPAQMRSEAQLLGSEFSKKTSFLAPAVIGAGREKIDGYLAAEPGLAPYRHPLDDILRSAAHVRSEEVEQVIAQIGPLAASPEDVRRTLANADMPWPSVELT